MAHPRVSFVPDEALPYTAETFARFNKQDMKSQSKTEAAVKLGKTVSDDVFGYITRVIHGFETLSEFYNNPESSLRVLRMLRDGGVLSDAQMAEMVDGVRGDERLSAVGRDFLENVLVGKAFASDPDVVRMLTAEPSMRSTVVSALVEITDNLALGDGYTLARQLSDAVRLCYDARKAGYKFGEPVSIFARQGELFAEPDELQTAADFNNATMLMLADVINSREVTKLRKTLALYNDAAREPASGQMDMFAEGGIRSREDVLRDVINYINKNGRTKAIKDAVAAGVARRREASVPKDGVAEAGIGGSENAERRGGGKTPVERKSDLAQAAVTAPLSEEVNEFDKPFVISSNGTTIFGEVSADSGLTAAPIKLSVGENVKDDNGANHGYGLLHIEAGHGDQIRAAGFSSVEEFVETVARNYDTIREGSIIADNQTYLLEVSDEHNNTLFIQLSRDGSYWNVNSAGIFKKKYSRRKPEVFTRPALETDTNTDTSGVDSGQANGVTTPAGNSPQTSESKGKGISSTSQAKGEKVAENQPSSGVQAALAAAEHETNTEPTEAQKEAGNYRKGHVRIDGFDVSIEQPKGSVRRGTDASGKQWEQTMHNTYGYIRGTEGVDGDHIDVFFSDDPSQGDVFVVDQVNKDGSFDEHKVMYGFPDIESARKAYLSNYEDGWTGLGAITPVSKEEFKKWVESSHRKTKPFAEYKGVNPLGNTKLDEQPTAGSFGPIYTQFKGRAKEAIAFLLEKKDGEAIAALHHKDIGDIDLVWGKEGTGKSDGYGLAKLSKYHPEVLDNLQELLDEMVVTHRSENRVQLESEMHQASVRLTWDNEKKNWLLTAFEKKNSALDNTTDTGKTSERGKRNDTATPQSTVSDGKVANNSASDQENVVKSYKITPEEYTTKRGKTLAMHLVTFDRELSKDEIRAGKELAKESRGWWDREKGGFMMRDEDSAKALAEALNNEEAVQDAQPLTLEDMKLATAEPVAEDEGGFHGGDTVWSKKHGENKHILMAHRMEIDGRSFVQRYTFTDGTGATAQEVEAAHEEERDPR